MPLRITACTELIESGQFSGDALARLYNTRGIGFEREEQNARAVEDYDAALAIRPAYAIGLLNRGYALKKLGRHEEAIDDLTASIALDGNDWLAYAHRGDSHAALGHREQAAADFEKSARYASPSGPVLNRNAYKFLAIGMEAKALSAIEQALERDPDNPYFLDTAGDVLCRLGRHEEAGFAYVSAFLLNPALTATKFGQLRKAGYDLPPPEQIAADEIIAAFSEWFLDGCPGVVKSNLANWAWIQD